MKAKLTSPSLVLTLGSVSILCLIVFYAVAQAQEQLRCFMIESSGQVTNLEKLCNSNSKERGVVSDAKEAFQSARQLAKKGQYQAAIKEYSRAIELDPEMYDVYAFRSAAFAMIPGQEHRGIEDARKAAEILRARGDEQRAKWMDQQVESVQGVIEERKLGIE